MIGDTGLGAGGAQPLKAEGTAAHLPGNHLGRLLLQLLGQMQTRKIQNTAALSANKVGVGMDVGSQTVQVLHHTHGDDAALR